MYVIRIIFSGMALVILAVSDALCHSGAGSHAWLLLSGAVYPHIGHLLLGRFDVRRRRGHLIFIVDGLFIGAVIGALQLAPIPSAILATINLFNWMVVGGATLVAFGSTALLASMALATPAGLGLPESMAATCSAPEWLAGAVLVGYFLIVGRVIHQLVDDLSQQQAELQAQADAAANARSVAERALLAILPPSVAQILAEKGEVPPVAIDNATLLLIELNWGRTPPSIGDLADAFKVCDTILSRYGFELVKTYGNRAIVLGRLEDGPTVALAASREVVDYFADHRALLGTADTRRDIRIVMHHGPVMLGLVQPERLNAEVIGETVDALAALAAIIPHLPPGTLAISVAAQRKLGEIDNLVLSAGDDRTPPCYLLKTEQPA
jgi:putative effector of murein hydrolase LrgA (UPF0299 family)